jgi:hypothetical protein
LGPRPWRIGNRAVDAHARTWFRQYGSGVLHKLCTHSVFALWRVLHSVCEPTVARRQASKSGALVRYNLQDAGIKNPPGGVVRATALISKLNF